jgi:hypothetical protein
VNKIIQGDWDWGFNRTTQTASGDWHNSKGDRKEAMLWGDGHISFYQFPTNAYVETDVVTPDPNYLFW